MRKIIFHTLVFLCCNKAFTQGCIWFNSAVNTNYCCGHDPELISQSIYHKTYSWPNGSLCTWGNYDQAKNPTVSYNTGDWMLIWEDGFNHYTKLDESFYRPVSQVASNINDGGDAWADYSNPTGKPLLYMQDPNLIKINPGGNGKLQLFEKYDANPSAMTEVFEYGGPKEPATFMHSDYTVGHLETKFRFPQSCRVQADIKTYPAAPTQWPAFWLYGERELELDIFEIPYEHNTGIIPSSIFNNRNVIMSYHAKEYGLPTTPTRSEGILDVCAGCPDLSTVFNKYELIWDDWLLQWQRNGNAMHTINRFYKLKSSWSSEKRKKNYRKYPVNNAGEFWAHSDGLFSNNRQFPGFFDFDPVPLFIIFNNQLTKKDTPLDPSYIDATKSMDMDYLKVWVKTYCDRDLDLNSQTLPITYPGQWINNMWIRRNYLATGRNVVFLNGNNVTILESQLALFVATNEIAFEPGFSADNGSHMFAFISFCESSANNRETHEEPDEDPDDDHEPYYYPDGSIDETDLVALENQHHERSSTEPGSHGILETQNDASANNPYMKEDIRIKTEESSFTIESTGGRIAGIELLDSKAVLILKEDNLQTASYKISKQLLSEGIYTCLIYTTTGVDVRKIWVWR